MKQRKSEIAFQKAFVKLMCETDYTSISVSDIVNQTSYSRRAFYSYYTDKDDFTQKLMEHELHNYVSIICAPILKQEKLILSDEPYVPALNFFRHVYNNKELYHLIIHNLIPSYSCEKFCEKAAQLFSKSISVVAPSAIWDQINHDFYMYCGTYLYMIYIKFWEMNNYCYSPEYMAQQITLTNKLKKIEALEKT